MCDNRSSTKDSIESKVGELEDIDDAKYNEGKEAFETFRVNVESQEKEIGELKITLNLKETNTEDEVDKIEEKLDFMKIYADNKELKDLEDAIKLKRDGLEDQAIIEEIKGLIDEETKKMLITKLQ